MSKTNLSYIKLGLITGTQRSLLFCHTISKSKDWQEFPAETWECRYPFYARLHPKQLHCTAVICTYTHTIQNVYRNLSTSCTMERNCCVFSWFEHGNSRQEDKRVRFVRSEEWPDLESQPSLKTLIWDNDTCSAERLKEDGESDQNITTEWNRNKKKERILTV